jgi:hypothetical protein
MMVLYTDENGLRQCMPGLEQDPNIATTQRACALWEESEKRETCNHYHEERAHWCDYQEPLQRTV